MGGRHRAGLTVYLCLSSDDRRAGPVGGRHRAGLTVYLCLSSDDRRAGPVGGRHRAGTPPARPARGAPARKGCALLDRPQVSGPRADHRLLSGAPVSGGGGGGGGGRCCGQTGVVSCTM